MESVHNFVKDITKGRDESHGYNHMNKVQKIACELATEMNFPLCDVSLVAILHDVADTKYDITGVNYLAVKHFLDGFLVGDGTNIKLIMKCIDCISFSKEKREGRRYYESILDDNDYWITVRNIVSDADKLEALGKIGLDRCLEYGRKHHLLSGKKLKTSVAKHASEKLLLLPSYFRTDAGRTLCDKRYKEFIREMTKQGIWEYV